MNSPPEWLAAFPVRPANEAFEAICESWSILASAYKPKFNPRCREPELTRVHKAHVEYVTSRNRGLLGMWAAESVINVVDLGTGEIIEERRTDIVYGWNDQNVGIQLVFEFKKLSRHARSRTEYLGKDGLERFVTGLYGKGQPVAAMVGVLTDPFDTVVPPLRAAFQNPHVVAALNLRQIAGGQYIDRPSVLFGAADFDTEHDRPPDAGLAQSPIRVAHCFLLFAYTLPASS